MRIHQLTLSDFGPFPGTHVVDFEELNDAGVFLVTGPTGAGKTSVLDAVCFALFGQVPGARGVKALRSDHADQADPAARPEVVLDFSVGGRRFVVRRTPEWQRPKRCGEGTTREKASASLLETTQGAARLLSSRAQEVGHFLSDLLGMTAGQFQQVAMLPQGEFQTFLRASSQDRHDVLQQLFGTERFTKIEDWVHDHSRRLHDKAAAGEALARRLVDTMADRAGVGTPACLGAEALARSASVDAVLPWADELLGEARTQLLVSAAEHDEATVALRVARSAHEEATTLLELRSRRDQARLVLARLGDDLLAARCRELLEADERAARCLPVLRLLDESLVALGAARSQHDRASERAPGVDDAREAAQEVISRLARVEALLPRERELRKTRESLRAGTQASKALAPRVMAAQEEATALPARRAAMSEVLEAGREIAGARLSAEAALGQAEAATAAALAAAEEEALLARQQDGAREARDAYADARERMHEVIERRLSGMAAELAAALLDGEPCQVCGSRDHPVPATGAADAVDEAAQLAATTETEALRRVHEAAVARVQETQVRLEGLRQASHALTPEAASAEEARCRVALDEVVSAERTASEAAAELARLDREATRLETLLRQLETESARLTVVVDGLAETAARLEAEIDDGLDGHGSPVEAAAELTRHLSELEALAQATTSVQRAEDDAARHHAATVGVARAHGFGGLDELRSASLDATTRATHLQVVHDHDTLRRDAEAVLADPAVRALTDEPVDVDALRVALAEAAERESAAARSHHVHQEISLALAAQRDRLDVALTEWAPARERYLTADSMSRLVRGMGSDNQLQMRLSSYVLATRLDQVVAAANERLTHMREQRYLLERTGDASRRGVQAGLGLRIVDEWTGETRAPATLSGGETFVVSLSLALGLSDVVAGESGGVQIGTLFIDEGFGMLDLDTLDDVMDRLDELRAGGRTVGVVSHVTELRNRIPVQLHVDKQRNGSSVRVTTLIA